MSIISNCCRRENFKKDRGYAWVVLVLSMISHSLHLGFSPAIVGNLTVVHQSFFGISLQESGLISTVHFAAIFLFGPISSLLVHKFGCRIAAIFGGICVVLGLGLSSLSNQPWHAFLLFGFLSGIGIPCLLVSTSEILSLHFEKYKNLAFSLAILGEYGGLMMWPVASQTLLDKYDYSKAMLILAAIQMVQILVGTLLIEPTSCSHRGNDPAEKSETNDVSYKSKCYTNLAIIDNNELDLSKEAGVDTDRPLERTNIDEVENKTDEVENKTDEVKHKEERVFPAVETNTGSFLQNLKSLLKSLQVWLLLLYSFLWGANDTTFYVYVNDCVLNRTGSTEEEIALGITIVGVACICGTLVVVLTSSREFDRAILNTVSVSMLAIATIAIAFSSSKEMFYALSAVFGLGEGGCIASLLAFINGFCAPNQLALLFGLVLFVQGIAVVSASSLVGYVSVQFGAEYGLMLSGCLGVAGVFCMLPVVINRIREKRNNRQE